MTDRSGTILHIQRLSTEDGPGIRTTVFFKGCPLKCAWCHNPESISPLRQVQRFDTRCIACGTCLRACPSGALQGDSSGIHHNPKRCTVCGACADACPPGAVEILGQEVSVAGLVNELVKDRVFFGKSGGGVTLSGGEPAAQADFCIDTACALAGEHISVALDTCGMVASGPFMRIANTVDIILYDLKFIDNNLHQHWAGSSNRLILENLVWLGQEWAGPGHTLWIRTPLIPGATATRENITAIAGWIEQFIPRAFERWELCAFNNLCRDKYNRLGMEWSFEDFPLMAQAELDDAYNWAVEGRMNPVVVKVTGVARLQEAVYP